jgi:UDP-glucose 4-epimerase
MKLLLTGGAGYIGSITNSFLQSCGHETVVFDNMSNGHKDAIGDTRLIIGDLKNKNDIVAVFEKESFDAVIHFAALALAGESMEKPYEYYHNNIIGGLHLLEAMNIGHCTNIIFSSTCAVYGYPDILPVTEKTAIAPVSVYGSSKRMFEEILLWYETIHGIKHVILRYFNACGSAKDGSIGEDHHPETHILPIAFDVILGKRSQFNMFGSDYPTTDGTCVRDYIHVLDLADAHEKAAQFLQTNKTSITCNVGVGKGYSNLEVLHAVEKITGKKLPILNKDRRIGDPAKIFADNTYAKQILGWSPKYLTIESIVESAWVWHKTHLHGYDNRH